MFYKLEIDIYKYNCLIARPFSAMKRGKNISKKFGGAFILQGPLPMGLNSRALLYLK